MLFYTLRGLELSPCAFHHILAALPSADADRRLDPDRFSLREIVAHLADFEPVFRGRIDRAILEDNPLVELVDEDARVTEGDYAGKSVQEWFDLWATEREKTTALIKSLQPDQLERTLSHPVLGTFTVSAKISLILGHDTYHLEQVADYLSSK